jgi:hypothetical protein
MEQEAIKKYLNKAISGQAGVGPPDSACRDPDSMSYLIELITGFGVEARLYFDFVEGREGSWVQELK